jgi:hypothetical protein
MGEGGMFGGGEVKRREGCMWVMGKKRKKKKTEKRKEE